MDIQSKEEKDGRTAVWAAGKKMPPEKEKGQWIEGTADEVICLGWMLDIGNILGKNQISIGDGGMQKEWTCLLYREKLK